jgi:hypothetical protein
MGIKTSSSPVPYVAITTTDAVMLASKNAIIHNVKVRRAVSDASGSAPDMASIVGQNGEKSLFSQQDDWPNTRTPAGDGLLSASQMEL